MKPEHTVVRLIAFHKTPSIYINDLTLVPIITSQQIKATNSLAEPVTYTIRPLPLLLVQTGDEAMPRNNEQECRTRNRTNLPDFFSFIVSPDHSVNNGGLPSFCVDVIFSNGVHLDIFGVVYIYELLIDV
jgi:hypothetical protein